CKWLRERPRPKLHRMRRMLPVVRERRLVRSPCDVNFEELRAVDGGHDCTLCDRIVIDTSELTVHEAVQLKQRAGTGPDQICATFLHDGSGNLRFRASD